MQVHSRCHVCFLDDIEGAMELLQLKENVKQDVMQASLHLICEALKDGEGTNIPSWFITRLHRLLKAKTGQSLLFRELRETCNRIGIEIASQIKAESSDLSVPDRLKLYMLYAMAGNHLDFRTVGTGYGIGAAEVRQALEETVAQGLTVDERDELLELIHACDSILFIPDNVGEIAFDKLLIDEILAMGKTVTVPYRGGAITSDAVLDDFREVGLEAPAKLICAGPDTLGISMDEMSDDLKKALETADLVITKGQANFYFMHEYMEHLAPFHIGCILTTKCRYISRLMGHDRDRINAVKIARREGRCRLEHSQ